MEKNDFENFDFPKNRKFQFFQLKNRFFEVKNLLQKINFSIDFFENQNFQNRFSP